MNTELRKRFLEKNDIIKRLYVYYETEKKNGLSYENLCIILDRIKTLKQEQKVIINKIKSNIYKSISIKEYESFSKKYRDKEIEIRKELLKKEEERKEKERLFSDARIVFDGEYKLYYNNDNNYVKCSLDVYYLHKNDNFSYDFNIMEFLKKQDELNGTDLYRRYMNEELPVSYDMTKKYGFLNKKQNEQLKRLTIDSNKDHKNVSLIKEKFSTKIKKAAAITALGLMGTIGIFSLFSKKNKNTNNKENNIRVEHVNEEEILKSNEELSTISNNVSTSIKIENNNRIKEDIINSHNVINNVNNKIYYENKVDNNSFDNISFNDRFKMDDVNLYYSSTD